jgi:N-acetylglucosamine-6-sulfatase
VVGERQGAETETSGLLGQLLGMSGAVEKAEVGVAVQFSVAMTQSTLRRTCALLALLAVGTTLALFSLGPVPAASAPLRPNVVFIMADDLDLASTAYMPLTQRAIGRQGATFSNFFTTHALCCPSRVTILRGQYEHNHDIRNNIKPDGGWDKFNRLGLESSTLGTWMSAGAYTTVYIGKYLNGYQTKDGTRFVPPGWHEWYTTAKKNSGGEVYNYSLNENGQMVAYGNTPADYLTDVLSNKAIDFIQRYATARKPFFMMLTPHSPHVPATPAPRHANLFNNEVTFRTPSFNEAAMSDKPAAMRNRPLLTDAEIAEMDALHRERLRSLRAVDEMVKRVVDTLAAVGKLDNTYIFFTSDNGFHQGQHRLATGKNTPYEEDIRVPMMVRGPGIIPGKVVNQLAGNVDFASTITNVTQVRPAHALDGRSLVQLWGTTKPSTWRQVFLLEKNVLNPQGYRGLRTPTHTYVEHMDGGRELYDLTTDPYQLKNSYASSDPTFLGSLASRTQALATCRGAGCRTAEE